MIAMRYHFSRYLFIAACLFSHLFPISAFSQEKPAMLLAQNYQQGIDVRQYLVSEKYDGVRAFWDGNQLISRQGNLINAPEWFTKDLPKIAMDGELWLARRKFDDLSSTVRSNIPDDAEWKNITYRIFELPNAQGTFEERYKRILEIVQRANLAHPNLAHLKAVTQSHVNSEAELKSRLKQVLAKGGEGLMLHRADALYITGRSDVLLKLKPLFDAEAKVIGYTAGKGKHEGKIGALLVETSQGIRFKLGTGLTDAQRENPPKIGSLVTYTYKDVTKTGKPRFASFLRVRNE